jgi:hypothetical protein
MRAVGLGVAQRVAVSVIFLSACSGGSVRALTAAPSTIVGHGQSYRWHSVTRSIGGLETTTIDGVADPKLRRYALHVHSSIGTAAGGNLVVSDGHWVAEGAHGVWCSDPYTASETSRANEDLFHASIDPNEWWSKLRDGQSSPTITMTRFTAFSSSAGDPLTAVIHRHVDTLTVTFQGGPAAPGSVLTFSDFGHAPTVVVPTGTRPCTTYPTGN